VSDNQIYYRRPTWEQAGRLFLRLHNIVLKETGSWRPFNFIKILILDSLHSSINPRSRLERVLVCAIVSGRDEGRHPWEMHPKMHPKTENAPHRPLRCTPLFSPLHPTDAAFYQNYSPLPKTADRQKTACGFSFACPGVEPAASSIESMAARWTFLLCRAIINLTNTALPTEVQLCVKQRKTSWIILCL